jgi:hypothetical protein
MDRIAFVEHQMKESKEQCEQLAASLNSVRSHRPLFDTHSLVG